MTDYNYNWQKEKDTLKVITLWLALRELPLRHFYARAAVMAFVLHYLVQGNWKTLTFLVPVQTQDTALYYFGRQDHQLFQNYPLLQNYTLHKRVTKTDTPGQLESEYWNVKQFQPFYMNHYKNFRYVFRNRRVVPWDGTFNQPIYPYLDNNDRTLFVHNGLSEIRELHPNPRE